jgi:hypothetical protein
VLRVLFQANSTLTSYPGQQMADMTDVERARTLSMSRLRKGVMLKISHDVVSHGVIGQ